jgi:hypothetical protein
MLLLFAIACSVAVRRIDWANCLPEFTVGFVLGVTGFE